MNKRGLIDFKGVTYLVSLTTETQSATSNFRVFSLEGGDLNLILSAQGRVAAKDLAKDPEFTEKLIEFLRKGN